MTISKAVDESADLCEAMTGSPENGLASENADLEPASVQAERRESRNRSILLGAGFAFFSKFPALLVMIVSVPLAIDALGEERFGVWVTVTTLLTLLRFLDGGAANAVINIVAECDQKQSKDAAKSLVSSVYAFLAIVACWCFGLQFLIVPQIDWGWLLSLPDTISSREVIVVTLAGAGSYFISMPLTVGAKVLTGLQKSHWVSIANSVANVVSVIATVIAWYVDAGLVEFVLCFAAQPILSGIISTWLSFRVRQGIYRPNMRVVSRHSFSHALKVGALFWVLQICAAVAYQCDALIVSHFAGLTETAKLGLVSRLFLVANSVAMLVMGPLWPAFREANLAGDADWVRQTFKKSMKYCMLVSIALTLPLTFFFNPINQIWTGGSADPTGWLVISVFLWSNLQVAGRIIAMLLNGLHVIKLQVICSILMMVLNVAFSIPLTVYYGASGVVLGSVLSFTLAILLPYCFWIPRVIDRQCRIAEGTR
ncbi:hypothetical protein LOC67_11170 [Stieleria sp. JC731]|uniref:lipopolysaccharide biosynthesis protein n=1 Tax=Pirellulaceae TaxID=2691357 RepID=UPI001E490890|nr:oligosaccharide flippase family protein [Stieleria sp. JC731]MCC9601108.1 hypothetical protein [Stieleria sp. JC731]